MVIVAAEALQLLRKRVGNKKRWRNQRADALCSPKPTKQTVKKCNIWLGPGSYTERYSLKVVKA
jgi:hypothetical protein